jgi:hypothetical protein
MEDEERAADDFAAEVKEIFYKVGKVCKYHNTGPVFAALSGMIGFLESRAEKPDMDDLMRLVDKTARLHFEGERTLMRKGMN